MFRDSHREQALSVHRARGCDPRFAVTVATRLCDRTSYGSGLCSRTHKTHKAPDATANTCWERAQKAEVFRGLADRSRPRAFARSYLSVFTAKAVHQVSNTHLEMKVIGGARTINIDGLTWRTLEWFFDPERDLLYPDRNESKYIGDGFLGCSHVNECRLSMVHCVPLARCRWFKTKCESTDGDGEKQRGESQSRLHPHHPSGTIQHPTVVTGDVTACAVCSAVRLGF